MNTHLDDLLDSHDLKLTLDAGYVRERVHPDNDRLTILNYAEKAQYEAHWTDITRTCRGLIYDKLTGEVLARPWAKFFNHGDPRAAVPDPSEPVEVTDKADGSLGILYQAPDGQWAIATRGSFASEQASHATTVLRDRYVSAGWTPRGGLTYLFEIVYPENRIVVDYAGLDDLILLGAVHIRTGWTRGPDQIPDWPGPRTETFGATSLTDALTLPPRPNAEGVVVRGRVTGSMLKIKQEDYVRLHRIVTGLSERSVYEHLMEHGNYTGLLETVPDEFHGWVRQHGDQLTEQFEAIQGIAHDEYQRLLNQLDLAEGDLIERREFAGLAKETDWPDLLFLLLDGRALDKAIWKRLRPVGHNPMKAITEDNA